MLLTQGVPYIDREQLGLSYISCPSLLRFRGPRHDNINLYISIYIVDHYLNIDLLELWSIVCQINIEKESDVWFGRYSQWLAQLADLPRQPFGLVFSLHSMQTSWGVLMRNIETFPSKQMYPYLSLDERKVAEFYHNIDRRR